MEMNLISKKNIQLLLFCFFLVVFLAIPSYSSKADVCEYNYGYCCGPSCFWPWEPSCLSSCVSGDRCYYFGGLCGFHGCINCNYYCYDTTKPSCPNYSSGGTCYYNGSVVCGISGWKCQYSADTTKASCNSFCTGPIPPYVLFITWVERYDTCGSFGWTCGSSYNNCGQVTDRVGECGRPFCTNAGGCTVVPGYPCIRSCGSGACSGTQSGICSGSSCASWGACSSNGISCGNCGTCSGGSCTGQGCSKGSTQSCGNCGIRICSDTCTWGSCTGQGCSKGSTQPCGNCGTQICSDTCTWGSCTGQGCSKGSTDSQACGLGDCVGIQTRDCLDTCTWDSWGSCSSESSSCGNCGICSGGSCGGEGVCDPGQPNNNPDCPCPADACIVDDYYDYPDYGDCDSSCNCECNPIIYSSCSFPNKPQSTSETWDYSAWGSTPQVLPGTSLILHWLYSDPESNPQASYEIWVDDDSAFTGSKFNILVDPSGSISYSLSLSADQEGDWLSQLNWNSTYYWQVRVKNSVNPFWSGWSDIDSFITRDHANPYSYFISFPQSPAVDEVVVFIQDNSTFAESLCYNDITGDGIGEEHQCQEDPFGKITYEWNFDYPAIILTSDKKGNASTTYSGEGSYIVRLLITDNTLAIGDNFSFHDVAINIGSPLPEWREVSPF